MDRVEIRRLVRGLVGGVLLGMAAGCAGAPTWVPVPPAPATFAPRQEIEVWHGGKATTLHGVQLTGDSLTGVPLFQSPACDSCRVTLPVQAIDSLRRVETEQAWMLTTALPFLALGAMVVAWRVSEAD